MRGEERSWERNGDRGPEDRRKKGPRSSLGTSGQATALGIQGAGCGRVPAPELRSGQAGAGSRAAEGAGPGLCAPAPVGSLHPPPQCTDPPPTRPPFLSPAWDQHCLYGWEGARQLQPPSRAQGHLKSSWGRRGVLQGLGDKTTPSGLRMSFHIHHETSANSPPNSQWAPLRWPCLQGLQARPPSLLIPAWADTRPGASFPSQAPAQCRLARPLGGPGGLADAVYSSVLDSGRVPGAHSDNPRILHGRVGPGVPGVGPGLGSRAAQGPAGRVPSQSLGSRVPRWQTPRRPARTGTCAARLPPACKEWPGQEGLGGLRKC